MKYEITLVMNLSTAHAVYYAVNERLRSGDVKDTEVGKLLLDLHGAMSKTLNEIRREESMRGSSGAAMANDPANIGKIDGLFEQIKNLDPGEFKELNDKMFDHLCDRLAGRLDDKAR